MSHAFRISTFISIACALMLTACGGGGSSDSTAKSADPLTQTPTAAGSSAADAYLGKWSGCVSSGETGSWSGDYTFSRDTDGQISYTHVKRNFDSPDCSGTEVGSLDRSGHAVWTGQTRMVGGNKADEVVFDVKSFDMSGMSFSGSPTASFKQLLASEAGELREGDLTSLGADGYPTEFNKMRYIKPVIIVLPL